ncbi:MAG: GNAT family N-acetyltransferase, partial [Ruminiclostridium sp.]|nr:GNAT family N-acetyltransferase [Ruminiclostridium sp.]
MELRKAEISDLIQLKSVFTEIVEEMTCSCNGRIWNDYYPCELFEDDIKRNELYVLTDNDIIVSAFVLCGTNEA